MYSKAKIKNALRGLAFNLINIGLKHGHTPQKISFVNHAATHWKCKRT